jgi:ABC-type multidrug transport system fused ATPase/permease subunit
MIPAIGYNLSFFGLTRRNMIVFVAVSLGAAFLEGFGMAMLLPVLEYVEKGQNVGQLAAASEMWRRLLKVYAVLGIDVSLFTLLVAAVGTMLLRVLAIYARQVYTAWLGQEMQHTTRSNLFDAYMGMDYGSITLTTEAQRAAGSFAALFSLLANIAVCLGFVVVLLWLSTPLTILAVVFLGISAMTVAYYVRHTRSFSHAATSANDRYSRLALERLGAFRLVKLTATSKREADRTRGASGEVRDLLYWLSRVGASVDLIMEPMVLISGGAILYLAISIFGMSLSEVGIFVLILLRLLPLAKEVMKSRQTYNACTGSLRAVIDSHAQARAGTELQGGQRHFGALKTSIRFKNVTFTYPGTQAPALADIDLTIPAGMVTALVGPSGAGKTTLADIIPRLRVPQRGEVLYDGIDGAEFELASLRRCMAFVSQDAVVLDDTVAGNLRFVRPEATDAELWDALSRAQAADFVRSLDRQLETRLGERGTRLSGGQKQRLSLARALLQDSTVLILDEPTSALDSETERDIQTALDNLRTRGGMTIVIIAHRLSTIRNADQIVVLKDGRVAEKGSHDALIISEDWYARASGMQSGNN